MTTAWPRLKPVSTPSRIGYSDSTVKENDEA